MILTKGQLIFLIFGFALIIFAIGIMLYTIPDRSTDEPEAADSPTFKALGDFVVTYYCSCEVCCEEWALNRPVVNGREIVFTASGAVAKAGVTIAVDPEVIPYGSTVYVSGVGYRVAQDCGGAIKGNKIDVYVNSHEATFEGGKHTSAVFLLLED